VKERGPHIRVALDLEAVVGLRTIKNGKRVIGILFGMVALLEGLFAIYIAKPTTIGGIGGILQSTFYLAGAQLIALGAVMVLVWVLYRNKRMEGKMSKVIPILMYLASAVMIAEGLVVALLSNDIMLGNVQGISKKFVALAGVQLFMIGLIQFSLWTRRDKDQHNWLFEWGAMMFTIALLGEGLLVMGISADTTIDGIGTVLKGTIFLAGLQLFLISGILLTIQLFREKGFLVNRLGKGRTNLLFSLLALAIAFEGLVMAYYSEPVLIRYSGSLMDSFGKLFIAMMAAQLFALSLLVLSSWKLTQEKLDRKTVVEFLGMGSGVVLATEGALVLGIAGNTMINNDIGGISTRTVMVAGLFLIVLGMIVLFAWHYRDNSIVKRLAGKGRMDVLMLLVGLVTGLGGVVVSALSANVLIQGFSGVSAKYIELAGVQLVLLASIMVLLWAVRSDGISQRMRQMSYLLALFMILLIPPAILM
jgi:hypothetical protein